MWYEVLCLPCCLLSKVGTREHQRTKQAELSPRFIYWQLFKVMHANCSRRIAAPSQMWSEQGKSFFSDKGGWNTMCLVGCHGLWRQCQTTAALVSGAVLVTAFELQLRKQHGSRTPALGSLTRSFLPFFSSGGKKKQQQLKKKISLKNCTSLQSWPVRHSVSVRWSYCLVWCVPIVGCGTP